MINQLKGILANFQAIDEHVIWELFKNGDYDAYEYFYQRYSTFLFRYGKKFVDDRDMVKDCIHDLFVELWIHKRKLGNPPEVKNYLAKSFRNKLLRQLKRNLKISYTEDQLLNHEFGEDPSPETALINEQMQTNQKRDLTKAIKNLTNRQKEIIFLVYYGDFSPSEVADIMKISVRTVYNTGFAAIQQLRKMLISLMTVFSLLVNM